MTEKLFLASKKCSQCLLSPNRIVDADRVKDIIDGCTKEGTHFICHKGTIAGINLHCRGFHDQYGSLAHSIAQAYDIPIIELDPDNLETK